MTKFLEGGYTSLADVVLNGFSWGSTDEGGSFWRENRMAIGKGDKEAALTALEFVANLIKDEIKAEKRQADLDGYWAGLTVDEKASLIASFKSKSPEEKYSHITKEYLEYIRFEPDREAYMKSEADWVLGGFSWDKTKEGSEFWGNFHRNGDNPKAFKILERMMEVYNNG